MGIKEKFTRANWELNCFMRTGKIPQNIAPTPHYPQVGSHTGWFGRRQAICGACGRQIRKGDRFCDGCGMQNLSNLTSQRMPTINRSKIASWILH